MTHIAITDHDRIDLALEVRAVAPAGLTVIVGEEVRTRDGDLICIFLDRAIAPGLSAVETIAAAREQGGLVGIPHPFDRMRGSLLRDAAMASLARQVDWVETHNARLVGHGNEDAATFAREHGLPGIAVSDAHSIMEIGVSYMALDGDPSTPTGLLDGIAGAELVRGRASYLIRLWTPLARGINRARGNRRVQAAAAAESGEAT